MNAFKMAATDMIIGYPENLEAVYEKCAAGRSACGH